MSKPLQLSHPVIPGFNVEQRLQMPLVEEAIEAIVSMNTFALFPTPGYATYRFVITVATWLAENCPLDPAHEANKSAWKLGEPHLWYINLLHLGMSRLDEILERDWPGRSDEYQPHAIRSTSGPRIMNLIRRRQPLPSYVRSEFPIILRGNAQLSATHQRLLSLAVAWRYRVELSEHYGHSLLHSDEELIMMTAGIGGAARTLAAAYPVDLLAPERIITAADDAEAWRAAIDWLVTFGDHVPRWHRSSSGHTHRSSHIELLMQKRPPSLVWLSARHRLWKRWRSKRSIS
jgi:hypothetical protein